MITRALKGLQDVVPMSHLDIFTIGKRGTPEYRGWSISQDPTGNNFKSAYEAYNSNLDYGDQQLTIPFLFDKHTKRVVSNDPAQIILMLNGSFEQFVDAEQHVDLYPSKLRQEIEVVNDTVYPGINDGVYRCWFARDDDSFDKSFSAVQSALQWVESRLQQHDYLCGSMITLADVRAFPHLFRYDVIYHYLMLRGQGAHVRDFPRVSGWLQRMFEKEAVCGTCDLQIATRFYCSPQLGQAECDSMYSSLKYDWMPSSEELALKRGAEQLPIAKLNKLRID